MGLNFLAPCRDGQRRQDLDTIRAALGDDKLIYLGYSYGTRIGSAYAEGLTQQVRAMILDGAVDPRPPLHRGGLRQARAGRVQPAAKLCARAGCRWAPTRPKPSESTTAWSIRWSTRTANQQAARAKDPREGWGYNDAPSWAPLWRCTHRICGNALDRRAVGAGRQSQAPCNRPACSPHTRQDSRTTTISVTRGGDQFRRSAPGTDRRQGHRRAAAPGRSHRS